MIIAGIGSGNHMRNMRKISGLMVVCLALVLSACLGESADSLMASAKKHLDKNEGKAAVIQLKNVLQKDPGNAQARYLLGKAMLDGGDIVGAGVELLKARELGHDPEPLIPLLARVALAKGEAHKVIVSYGNETLKSPSAQADLQLVLASAYFALGKVPEAQAAAEAALKAVPDHFGTRLLQVRLLAAAKDVPAALAALDKVIVSMPASSEARQLKGELLFSAGQIDAALAAFGEATKLDSSNVAAYSASIWILIGQKNLAGAEAMLAKLREVAPRSSQTKFFTASLAFERGDLRAASEQLGHLLQQAPESAMALQLAGAVELAKGSLLQAEAHLGKALQLVSDQTKLRLLLAQVYLRAGDGTKAIKIVQPLVDNMPLQWEPQVLMAQGYLMSGDAAKAELHFEQAAKLNPQDVRSRTALALAQWAKGDTARGFEALDAISVADPGIVADLARVSAYLHKKDYENALKAINRLETKQPKSPIAANLRGRAELQRGRPDAARDAFVAALAIDPSFFPAALSIVALDVSAGKSELARQRLEKFMQAYPKDIRAGLALAKQLAQAGANQQAVIDVIARTVKANPVEVSPRLALIGLQLHHKDFKAALKAAQEALVALPDNAELLDVLGQAQYYSGDVKQAVKTYTHLAAIQPTATEPLMRLAEIYRAEKDMTSAAASLRKAVAIRPDFLPAQQALVLIDLAERRPKDALNIARTIQRRPGGEAVGLSLEGDVAALSGNWSMAAGVYRRALDKQASTDIAIKLHSALAQAERGNELAKFEQEWLARHPSDAAFLHHLGDAALAKGQYELARQRYAAVVKTRPDSAPALNNLAWLLAREKKPEALELAMKAVKLSPNESTYMDTLAEVYARNGDLTKAIEAQQAAVAASPENAMHRLHLAGYYLSANEKAKAKVELDRLAVLGDRFAGQPQVKAMQAKL